MSWRIRVAVAAIGVLLNFPALVRAQTQMPAGTSSRFPEMRFAHFVTLKCGFLTREQTTELEDYTRRLYIADVTRTKEAPAQMSALDDEVKKRAETSPCAGKSDLVKAAHREASAYLTSRDASYYEAAIDIGKRCGTITPDQVTAIQKKKLAYDDRVTGKQGPEYLAHYRKFLQDSRTAFQALPCAEGPKLLNWAMSDKSP